MSKNPIFDILARSPEEGFLPPGYWTASIANGRSSEVFGRIPDDAPAKSAEALAEHLFFQDGIDPTAPLPSGLEGESDFAASWSDYESADAKLKTAGGRDTAESGSGKGKAVGKGKNTEDASTDTTTGGTEASPTDTSPSGDTTTSGTDDPAADTGGSAPETNTGSTDPNNYVSGLDTPDGFNIELVFEGEWDAALQQVVTDAAETLSDLITGDIPSYNGVDDIKIQVYLTDGALAQGGHFMARDDSSLPSNGFIMLNSDGALAALDGGYLDEVVLHEMLHALGFGTSWETMGLVSDHEGDLRFTGANATEVYQTLNSNIAVDDPLATEGVPVETDGGAGTAGKHWDEATFGEELMTGSLTGEDLLSSLSLAALEDMGYETVYGEDPVEDPLLF